MRAPARFSRRTDHDREENAWSRSLADRRRTGLPVLDLTQSNPTQAGLPYVAADVLGALSDPRLLRYEPEAFGLSSARSAVAKLYDGAGFAIPEAQIVLTASTSEAYAFLFKLLCDPGDEVLIPAPSYPLFEHLAAFESVRAVPYLLRYDGAWYIDFDSLERALGPKTRAVVLVSPNNPTGSFLKRQELERLGAIGLPLVSDEVFASYSLFEDSARACSALECQDTLVFALGGLSKLAALPQLKLAWTAVSGPEPQLAEALGRLELIADTFLSPNTPVQLALPRLLAERHTLEAALALRIRSNLAALKAALDGTAATALFVEGGWYAVVSLPALIDEMAWVTTLLAEDGVLTQPGHFYDFADAPYLILSLITEPSAFELGASRIAARVSAVVGGDG